MSDMFYRNSLIWLLPASIALAWPAAVMAQSSDAAQQDAPAKEDDKGKAQEKKTDSKSGNVQQVTVTGGKPNAMEERRQSSAAKMVFGREELERNGDSNLADVLKRLPGINLGGRPGGRGGEIRMRGMGSGYTQILLNGERAPRGFDIGSLAPDQVERIEIIRGTVAEHSTQAIAGTINIILREGFRQRDIQLKMGNSFDAGKDSPNLGFSIPGKLGRLEYTINGNLSQNNGKNNSSGIKRDIDLMQNRELMLQDSFNLSQYRSDSLHFAPRLVWKAENGDSITLQTFAMHSRTFNRSLDFLRQQGGTLPAPYAKADSAGEDPFSMARLMGQYVSKLGNSSKLEFKFGASSMHFSGDSLRTELDSAGRLIRTRIDGNDFRERGANLGLKFSTPIGEGHQLAMGVDGEYSKRTQQRISLINGAPDLNQDASDENLQANNRRLAAFIQDEWDINKQWALNLGLRWESIRVRSGGPIGGAPVQNSSRVLSPIAHAVWRIPGKARDQVRMSATHSYRASALSNLIAAPYFSNNNTATSPDRFGNPALKPEQALGLELAYEHYLSEGGILSANLFARNIRDMVRSQTSLQNTPLGLRWVSQPTNIGRAQTRGVELEAKFRLPQLIENAPELDVRLNYTWAWSMVEGIPGPDNRIDSQPKHSGNIGLDYRIPQSSVTLGGSLNYTPAYVLQISPEQRNYNPVKRQLDVYGLWKINSWAQLRVSAANLLARDFVNASSLLEKHILHENRNINGSNTVWSLRLELQI
ncbi:TonB-dependent receptor [Massilia sp. W12]|uniref:TonB-dependent receptor plug domain-containing protein n=1 Tax=Massilia sp. W12 TaxID=3126507 RepID=UPI0030CF225E